MRHMSDETKPTWSQHGLKGGPNKVHNMLMGRGVCACGDQKVLYIALYNYIKGWIRDNFTIEIVGQRNCVKLHTRL